MPAQTEKEAIKTVDKHVSPKECFIWFMDSKRGFEAIPGTGCAHWVAHEKGWKGGKSGSEVAPADVAVGNVWINDKQDHCGIVCKVETSKDAAKEPNPTIEIEHCSSGQGKVAKNDWAKYFKSGGKFYKG